MRSLLQEGRQKKIIDEQNRRALEKQQQEQEQRDIAGSLVQGGEGLNIPAGLSPQLPAGIQGFNEFTPEQRLNRLKKLDTGGLNYYNALDMVALS